MLNRQSSYSVERLRDKYAATASQMLCPVHQKNAKVDVALDDYNIPSVEIFTCCDQFRDRVRRAFREGSDAGSIVDSF